MGDPGNSILAEILGVKANTVFKWKGGYYYITPHNYIFHAEKDDRTLVNGFIYAELLNSSKEIETVIEPTQEDIEMAKAVKLLFPESKTIRRGNDGNLYVKGDKAISICSTCLGKSGCFPSLLNGDEVNIDDILKGDEDND